MWPGNLDILLSMMRAFRKSYILDVYLNLFEEYQCTTLNLNILWVDNVGPTCSITRFPRMIGEDEKLRKPNYIDHFNGRRAL
jgi:hypothetical protein